MNKPMQVRITRPVVVREFFETASWERKIELPPGIYPMRQYSFGTRNDLVADIPGTVVSSYFPSSFCGNQFGDGNVDKEKGQTKMWQVSYKAGDFWDGSLVRMDGAIVIEEAEPDEAVCDFCEGSGIQGPDHAGMFEAECTKCRGTGEKKRSA
jgi:hypothetical protein